MSVVLMGRHSRSRVPLSPKQIEDGLKETEDHLTYALEAAKLAIAKQERSVVADVGIEVKDRWPVTTKGY